MKHIMTKGQSIESKVFNYLDLAFVKEVLSYPDNDNLFDEIAHLGGKNNCGFGHLEE